MTVSVDGQPLYRWPVSTGATGFSTPTGSYTPFRMEIMHYSQEWDNAGMPHAIFFTTRGHSIHGSDHPGLGTPVSHGCVRLSLPNATTLYALVHGGRHGEDQGHRERARSSRFLFAEPAAATEAAVFSLRRPVPLLSDSPGNGFLPASAFSFSCLVFTSGYAYMA